MSAFDPGLPPVTAGSVPRIADDRGVLTKVLADGSFGLPAFSEPPRQVLHSGTASRGTLRGLHAQTAPYTESKLIVSLTGTMFWVTVDLRRGSRSFGRWQGYELSTGGTNALHVPAGFGHGCLSLTDAVNLLIMADRDFSPGHGVGIAWNDPDLAIAWPAAEAGYLMSGEHAAFASFAAFRDQHGGL